MSLFIQLGLWDPTWCGKWVLTALSDDTCVSEKIFDADLLLHLALQQGQLIVDHLLTPIDDRLALGSGALDESTIAQVDVNLISVLQFGRDESDVTEGNHDTGR